MKRFLQAIFLLFLLTSYHGMSTHLRAADIVAERISEKGYFITLTLYTDYESVSDGSGDLDVNKASVEVAGESIEVSRTTVTDIGNQTFKNEYSFEYEFPSTNANYIISYTGIYRNNGIVNMAEPSHLKALYIETFVRVDDATIGNRTPQLLNAPIDLAAVGQEYTHNPGAWDPDGDSISFVLLTPQQASGDEVEDYRFPNHPTLGVSTFTLDPNSGDVSWFTPTIPGEYNVAFMIEEWRNGARIGYVIRDMQILVEDTDNEKPELVLPPDTCLAAGEVLIDTMIAFDPDDHSISLTYSGGIPNLGASIFQNQILNDSIVAFFSWSVNCSHVQGQPHEAVFRVEDNFTIPLSTTKSWSVTVIAPAPENVVVSSANGFVHVEWDLYDCGSEAEHLLLWRSLCDSGNIFREPCVAGVPDDWGYELLAHVSPEDTSYIDSLEVLSGSKYCYLMSAEYGVPSFGESYASGISCVNLDLDVPFISNVSVLETAENGQVQVSWSAPLELDTATFGAPYFWQLYRSKGILGDQFDVDPVFEFSTGTLIDSSFIDSGLNTLDSAWSYKLSLSNGNSGVKYGESNITSSVWLDGEVRSEQVALTWFFNSSWSQDGGIRDLLIDTNTVALVLDSVQSSVNDYVVDGLINGEEYCYQVKERYGACHDSIEEIYESISNRACFVPIDTVPPCPPVLSLEGIDCDNYNPFSLNNDLEWLYPATLECSDNVNFFRLYYTENVDGQFTFLDSVDGINSSYSHQALSSVTMCYKVTAVDDFGNESDFSNVVCQDGCDSLVLPNVFTPNGDPFNDEFVPKSVQGSLRSVHFKVYNRWGKLVYETVSDPTINWQGNDSNGNRLSDGVYYYIAEVEFDRLFEGESSKVYKGWVTLLR